MDTTVWIVAALIAGFYLGWKISSFINAMAFKDILDDLNVTDRDLNRLIDRENQTIAGAKPTVIVDGERVSLRPLEIKIEEHNGCLYAYRLSDDHFLAQGESREDLIQRLTENLTNVRLIISEENGAKFLTL